MNYKQVIEKYGKDFITEWTTFKDGAVGCVVKTINQDIIPLTGWSICSTKDRHVYDFDSDTYKDNFDPIKGEAIALLRAQADDKGFDNMFRNIPTQYYKDMVLKIFDVKPM